MLTQTATLVKSPREPEGLDLRNRSSVERKGWLRVLSTSVSCPKVKKRFSIAFDEVGKA